MKKQGVVVAIQPLWVLLACALSVHPARAQESAYRRLELAYGISLDVPAHWTVLSQDARKNLAAFGEAMMGNAGVEGPRGHKEALLAVNSAPTPTGATIRVSVTTPPDFTQAELTAMTSADLRDLRGGMRDGFKKLEASGGPHLIEMQAVHIEQLSGHTALVVPYVRRGMNGPSPWQVTQYCV